MGVIETARSVLRRPFERFLSPKPTLVERQYRLKEVLQQHPVTNEAIWWLIVAQRGHLTLEERDRVVRNYKIYRETFPDDNPTVTHLLSGANLQGFRRDRFFDRVTFNYDRAFGAEERHATAMDELRSGQRQMVDHQDPQFWTLERWVDHEFARMQRPPFMVLTQETKFNRELNAEEIVYRATNFGIIDFDDMRRELPAKAFPLLDVTEIIKPSPLTDWVDSQRPARVARLFGDAETITLKR